MITLITEISPIFGLTLLGMMEIAVLSILVGATVGIVSSLIVAYTIHKRNIALLEQQKKASSDTLEQQRIINSAKLSILFLEYWKEEKHERFQEYLKKIRKSKINILDREISTILTIFEDIAILWKEGTLTDNHVKQFFGNPLRDIRDNAIMQDRIKMISKHEPDFILVNLRALLQETVKWKI